MGEELQKLRFRILGETLFWLGHVGICETMQLRLEYDSSHLLHPFLHNRRGHFFFFSGGVCILMVHHDLIFLVFPPVNYFRR